MERSQESLTTRYSSVGPLYGVLRRATGDYVVRTCRSNDLLLLSRIMSVLCSKAYFPHVTATLLLEPHLESCAPTVQDSSGSSKISYKRYA